MLTQYTKSIMYLSNYVLFVVHPWEIVFLFKPPTVPTDLVATGASVWFCSTAHPTGLVGIPLLFKKAAVFIVAKSWSIKDNTQVTHA